MKENAIKILTLEPGPSWKRNAAFLVECDLIGGLLIGGLLIGDRRNQTASVRRLAWQPQTLALDDHSWTSEVRPRASLTGSEKGIRKKIAKPFLLPNTICCKKARKSFEGGHDQSLITKLEP